MKKIILPALLNFCAVLVQAQSAHVDIDGNAVDLINRLSTLSGALPDDMHNTVQPLLSKDVASFMEQARLYNTRKGWSSVDNSNIMLALSNSGEWSGPDGMGAIASKKEVGPFYPKITDMIYYNDRRFFLSVNPVLGVQGIYENADDVRDTKFNFAAGAKLRAKYKDHLGLDLNVRYISEQPLSYYQAMNLDRNTLIGAPRNYNYNAADQRYAYLLPTGSISARLLADNISVNVGYDVLKMGDGHRGLMLSDFSGPVGYANIRTKVWKLQYDNLYLRISPDQDIPGNPLTNVQPNFKFATAHQLSVNVSKWLNIGVYEMVVFNRQKGFELGYLNPIVFYRAIERSLGSPDKVALGINARAIAAKHLRVYGQFLLNEFTAREFFATNGYMHNKWGAQLGFNYYDAFSVSNLDLQVEGNVMRPYTFQHTFRGNTEYIASNFTNNNLPLGHPLGAGFREAVFIAKYRPGPRVAIEAKAMLYQRGVDTGNLNLGNDLSRSYGQNVPSRYGVRMVNGPMLTRTLYSLRGTYQIAPNLFFDLGGVYGSMNYGEGTPVPGTTDHYHIFSGIRLNMAFRDQTAI